MCVSSSAMQCRDTTVNLEATNAFLTGDTKTGIFKKKSVCIVMHCSLYNWAASGVNLITAIIY